MSRGPFRISCRPARPSTPVAQRCPLNIFYIKNPIHTAFHNVSQVISVSIVSPTAARACLGELVVDEHRPDAVVVDVVRRDATLLPNVPQLDRPVRAS
jgi:hypothetical protein